MFVAAAKNSSLTGQNLQIGTSSVEPHGEQLITDNKQTLVTRCWGVLHHRVYVTVLRFSQTNDEKLELFGARAPPRS